jgi:hypothetical protein
MTLMLTRNFESLQEGGLTELIGINEEVNTNDYSASVGVALQATCSGEILHVTLYTTEDGTGAVLSPAGVLYIFDADPSITSGATAMTAAARVTVIAQLGVAAADWKTDANGGSQTLFDKPVAFHNVGTLYFAWLHEDATDFNDAAGDDEQLEFNFWYRPG